MSENPCPCPDPLAPCAAFHGKVLGQYLWRVCRGEELTPPQCEAYRRLWSNHPPPEPVTDAPPPPPPPAPAPPLTGPWPRWALALKKRRREGEKGVGDTLARLLAGLGGEALKRAYKKLTGQDCGCASRQALLNQQYPYA